MSADGVLFAMFYEREEKRSYSGRNVLKYTGRCIAHKENFQIKSERLNYGKNHPGCQVKAPKEKFL